MRHIWPLDIDFEERHGKSGDLELAASYVVYQTFEKIYSPLDSLKRGTAFEQLDKPYYRKEL